MRRDASLDALRRPIRGRARSPRDGAGAGCATLTGRSAFRRVASQHRVRQAPQLCVRRAQQMQRARARRAPRRRMPPPLARALALVLSPSTSCRGASRTARAFSLAPSSRSTSRVDPARGRAARPARRARPGRPRRRARPARPRWRRRRSSWPRTRRRTPPRAPPRASRRPRCRRPSWRSARPVPVGFRLRPRAPEAASASARTARRTGGPDRRVSHEPDVLALRLSAAGRLRAAAPEARRGARIAGSPWGRCTQ